MGEKIFGNDFYEKSLEAELLQTIRVPKNLLYLTDRLPKPHYEQSPRINRLAASSVIKSYKKEEVERLPSIDSKMRKQNR